MASTQSLGFYFYSPLTYSSRMDAGPEHLALGTAAGPTAASQPSTAGGGVSQGGRRGAHCRMKPGWCGGSRGGGL